MDKSVGFSLRAECFKTETATKEENAEFVRRIQSGDKSATTEFILKNGKLITSIIKTYYPSCVDSDDAFQQGAIGLLKAVEKFDASMQEASVTTYAYDWIRQSVGRYIHESGNMVHIPIHACETLNKIKRSINKYNIDTDGNDLKKFVCKDANIDEETYDWLIPYTQSGSSLNSIVGNNDGDESSELQDFIADDNISTSQSVENKIMSNNIRKALREILNDKEYIVICYRAGLGCEVLTFEEIGNILGISRQAVQTMEARIMKKLRIEHGDLLRKFLG